MDEEGAHGKTQTEGKKKNLQNVEMESGYVSTEMLSGHAGMPQGKLRPTGN